MILFEVSCFGSSVPTQVISGVKTSCLNSGEYNNSDTEDIHPYCYEIDGKLI